jgi:bifunctional enzyme CysN/CysC/sulfate adenylyltransferase subunit 1
MSVQGPPLTSALSEIADLFPASGEVLRFTTAGSVDDGKSTLIGRLLHDSHGVYEDQLASVRNSRINRSSGPLDFSLLTDGLRAEREQGITIDVAYRYFSTPRRKFIIADTPGHEQYTRNMATGASTADAAVVLIDATKGVLSQSRRHAYIASLLGIRHVVAAVNKMDIVGYSQEVFDRISREFFELSEMLGLADVYPIPVSALEGDNVVSRSANMPWFDGAALLEHLENIKIGDTEVTRPARFPVQYVIRPDSTFRGYAGQVESGSFRRGQQVFALPSNVKTRIKSILTFDGELEEAMAGRSVTLNLEDEVDVSRGDLLVAADALPSVSRKFDAGMVWLHPDEVDQHKLYLLKHTTRLVRARVTGIHHRIDMDTLARVDATTLRMNDIASVSLETTLPLFFDLYREIKGTGSFILIDPVSNATVAAGMIEGTILDVPQSHHGVGGTAAAVTPEERYARFGHGSGAVWVEGRPELARLIERRLFDDGWQVKMIEDADSGPSEMTAVARVLQASGIIAILSVVGHAPDKDQVCDLFTPTTFFDCVNSAGSDVEAAAAVVNRLTIWREAMAIQGNGAE